MATNGTVHLDKIHFNNFRVYDPRYQNLDQNTIDTILDYSEFQVSSALENTIAYVGGHNVVRKDSHDLFHPKYGESEVKLRSTREHSKSYGINVITRNKKGPILLQAAEQLTKKCYFFVIPYHAYHSTNIVDNKIKDYYTEIEIPFYHTGEPKKSNHWWRYEVKTFEEMSKWYNNPANLNNIISNNVISNIAFNTPILTNLQTNLQPNMEIFIWD